MRQYRMLLLIGAVLNTSYLFFFYLSLHVCLPFSFLEYDVRSKSGFPFGKKSRRVVSASRQHKSEDTRHCNGNVHVGLEKVFKPSRRVRFSLSDKNCMICATWL